MKTVTITPDLGISSVGSKGFLDNRHSVKITCECGWVEKAVRSHAESRAKTHLLKRHNGGIVNVNS